MGHRKKHAPKRGSLAYLPRGRCSSSIGRVRYWPKIEGDPVLLGFSGYKAGMTVVFMIENSRNSPNYSKELAYPATIIESPPMIVCALKAYKRTNFGLKALDELWAGELPKDVSRLSGVKENPTVDKDLKRIENRLEEISEIRVLLATQPRLTSVPKKKPDIMEVKVGGGDMNSRFNYATNLLGKTISANNLFKEGQSLDVTSITKGKGWQGVVKRWGVRILQHKSRKTKRGIATLGPWHPARVLYTVPRAGQMGYHQRTEYNKRILKIGENGKEINPKGGFLHYGFVKGDFLLLAGSVPGPAKRLIRLRYPARPPRGAAKEPSQITCISLKSHQGR